MNKLDKPRLGRPVKGGGHRSRVLSARLEPWVVERVDADARRGESRADVLTRWAAAGGVPSEPSSLNREVLEDLRGLVADLGSALARMEAEARRARMELSRLASKATVASTEPFGGDIVCALGGEE